MILCAGNIVFDILVRPVETIAWNTTTWVDSIEHHMGGNGANTAYTLATLGVPVRLASITGHDLFGTQLLDKLRDAGVDVSTVKRTDAPAATTVGLVNPKGDRYFLHRPGASAEPFPIDFTPGLTHFHLGNPFAFPNLRRHYAEVMECARAAGLTTSIDTGWDSQNRWLEDLGEALPLTDILFVNEDEACRFAETEPYDKAASRLRSLGARCVVVKRGAHGCAVFAETETVEPAFEVTAVDTTGAGDCFAGAYLAALYHKHENPARFANAVAAITVRHIGATTGLGDLGASAVKSLLHITGGKDAREE